MSPRLVRVGSVERAVMHRIQAWRRLWLTPLMRSLSTLGNASVWTLLGVTLVLAGGSSARFGLRLGVAAGLASLVVQVLKRLIRRPRPSVADPGLSTLIDNPDAFSFPSGHTAAAFAVAIAFVGEGAALGPASLALAGGIGTSRVYLGAHYPLDVMVGAVLGATAGVAARLLIA